MLKLMRLELKRHNIKPYINSSIIICFLMICFLCTFAYLPRLDPDPDVRKFVNYNNMMGLFSMLNTTIFCILSSVMYSQFVIAEYSGKSNILLFSYPIKREKIMLAKLSVVFLFTALIMSICNFIVLLISSIINLKSNLMNDIPYIYMIIRAIKLTFIMTITAAELGVIATGIGFIKKSVPTTIISAILLATIPGNIVLNSLNDDTFDIIFMAITIISGTYVAIRLMNKVKQMEVE